MWFRRRPTKATSAYSAVLTWIGPHIRLEARAWVGRASTATTAVIPATAAGPLRPRRAMTAPTTTTRPAIRAGPTSSSSARTPVTAVTTA